MLNTIELKRESNDAKGKLKQKYALQTDINLLSLKVKNKLLLRGLQTRLEKTKKEISK